MKEETSNKRETPMNTTAMFISDQTVKMSTWRTIITPAHLIINRRRNLDVDLWNLNFETTSDTAW